MTTTNLPTSKPQSKEDYEAAGGQTANTRIEINTGGRGTYAIGPDGKPTVLVQRYHTTNSPDIDTRIVTVNGMTVKREVYEQLVRSGGLPPDAKVIDYAPHKSEEALRPFAEGGEEVADLTADAERKTTEAVPVSDPETEAVFAKGDAALEAAKAQLGEEAVSSAIESAVISSDLTPPKGASEVQVAAVVAAYTASANEMLTDLGVSVSDLSLVLSEGELRDARRAVVAGDVDRMRSLGSSVVDTLASLPARDPDLFASYVEHRFPNLEWEIVKGRALVRVEGRGMVPWDNIVRGGFLNRARVVEIAEGGE